MGIETVGVVGAGIMGCGLAADLSAHGYRVVLVDSDEVALTRSSSAIRQSVQLLQMTDPSFRNVNYEEVTQRISSSQSFDRLNTASFIIENVTEDYSVKKEVYEKLREVADSQTIFAVNTSCISITKIGSLMPDPSKVVGMHFMNPVPMKKMVETIRGHHTSDDTVNAARNLAASLGKEAIVVEDYPGFVTNRVMMLTINECAFLVQDGVASPKEIDKIFRLGFSHKMGPLATADLIGLDTILQSIVVLYESYNDSKYRPCPLLKKMVDAGHLGRKSGEGFFRYTRS